MHIVLKLLNLLNEYLPLFLWSSHIYPFLFWFEVYKMSEYFLVLCTINCQLDSLNHLQRVSLEYLFLSHPLIKAVVICFLIREG